MKNSAGNHSVIVLMAGTAFFLLALITTDSAVGDPVIPLSNKLSPSTAAMAEYNRALAEYNKAQQAYAATANAYWNSIAQKRQLRTNKRANHMQIIIDDYVLTQPPAYSGPAKPVNPAAPKPQVVPPPYVPVVADFLKAAMQEFGFSPQLPQAEIDFKRAYANVASAAGVTKDQAVRIYGFEDTGNGKYDTQAGLEYNKPGEHAVTTAIGYNQLIATSSVELMAEKGDQFIKTLSAKAAQLPDDQKKLLQSKIAIVQKMVEFSKSAPNNWDQHKKLAGTPKGLGIHAMNLDLDVGPLLQAEVLVDSIAFARSKGHAAVLSAVELEMMNLTGDGNGYDIVTMPLDWHNQVPTANFFDQNGYEDNPVVRTNNVVGTLIAATESQMDEEANKQGAMDLAAAFPN